MAAELLDIEAKLDTSQVQGQLSQLSKTAGLQNLDKAIKQLEMSMKRLTQVMNQQVQAASGGGSGFRNGANGGGFNVSRGLIRTAGVAVAGRVAGNALDTYNDYLHYKTGSRSTRIDDMRNLSKRVGGYAAIGAGIGSVVPGLGTGLGAGIGAAIGALQSAFEKLANDTKALSDSFKEAQKTFATAQKRDEEILKRAEKEAFLKKVDNSSYNGLTLMRKELDIDKNANIAALQDMKRLLEEFKKSSDYKFLEQHKDDAGSLGKNKTARFNNAAKTYDDLTKAVEEAQKALDETTSKQKTINDKQDQLAKAEEEAAKALMAQKDALKKQYQDWSLQKSLGDLSKRLSGMSLNDLRSGTKNAEDKADSIFNKYGDMLRDAQGLKDLKDIEQANKNLDDLATQLKNAEQELGVWQEALKKAEQVEAERAEMRSDAQSELRSLRHQIGLEDLESKMNGMSLSEIQTGYNNAKSAFENQRALLMASLGAQSVSDKPEEFADEIDNARTKMAELEDVMKLWQSRIEESAKKSAFNSNPLAAIGNMNLLEQAGYFGMASQDKTIEDLTQQILNYVRRITANTETQTSTNDETFGNY